MSVVRIVTPKFKYVVHLTGPSATIFRDPQAGYEHEPEAWSEFVVGRIEAESLIDSCREAGYVVEG